MILVESLLYKLDQRLNKLSSNTHQQIELEDKILALNEAQILLIKTKIDVNNVHRLGLDSFKKRYQDLQFLVENYEDHILTPTLSDPNLGRYISKTEELTPKFMFYLDSYIIASKGDCKGQVMYTNSDLIKHSDLTLLLNNSNYKPSFEYRETIVDISSDELHFYTDGTFTIDSARVSYIRYPKQIDFEGYVKFDGTDSVKQDCELEDYLEDELLDLAVRNLAMFTENQAASQNAQIRIQTSE